mgnify:CR=1 FL=1|tara:strand:+ start:291 stop:1409 length:1119 start_codon:yes stop_codon:yes gene_type:complete
MKRILNYFMAKFLALKRRFYIAIKGDFDPYPNNYENLNLSPSEFIKYESETIESKLDLNKIDFDDLNQWKIKSKNKLIELLNIKKNLYFKIISENTIPIKKNYIRKRIFVEFSKFRHAPLDIVSKKNNKNYKGIIFCMQGTNSGAHLSLGEIRMPGDVLKVEKGSDLAIQAAEQDYLAVSFERIGFGERREQKLNTRNNSPTLDASFHSIHLGNTLLGENVKEIILINKWLKKEYNDKKLWLVGYSAAGTTIIASAAVDDNIDGIAVGGCVGQSRRTILNRGTSGYNDIPNMLEWFDFDAQIGLISPRPCIIIAGVKDHIWPFEEALKTVSKSKKIFIHDSAEDKLILIKAHGGHTYYPNLMWPAISRFFIK